MTARMLPAVIGVLATVALLSGCSTSPTDTSRTGAEAEASAEPSAAATPLDGVYRWSTTEEQAIGTPAERDIGYPWGPTDLASVPNTFTMTLDEGTWTIQGTTTPQVDSGVYRVEGNRLELEWRAPSSLHGEVMPFTFTRDPDGTLHLTPAEKFDEPVDAFVFALNPWVRIG